MSERDSYMSDARRQPRTAKHDRDVHAVDRNEDHMSEDMVQKMFLDRVMGKIDGGKGGSAGRTTQEEKQIEEDCRNL